MNGRTVDYSALENRTKHEIQELSTYSQFKVFIYAYVFISIQKSRKKSHKEHRTDHLLMPPPCLCVMSFPDRGCGIGLNIHTSVRGYNKGPPLNAGTYN